MCLVGYVVVVLILLFMLLSRQEGGNQRIEKGGGGGQKCNNFRVKSKGQLCSKSEKYGALFLCLEVRKYDCLKHYNIGVSAILWHCFLRSFWVQKVWSMSGPP